VPLQKPLVNIIAVYFGRLLLGRAISEDDKIALINLSGRAGIPSAVNEIRFAKHFHRAPISVIAEADKVQASPRHYSRPSNAANIGTGRRL
jgi:hypothetical protein